ncbi:Os02g0573601, partial [Oryza sativa Japonica Group]
RRRWRRRRRLDEALPVPVLRPHRAERLDGHPLGLRQEERHERRHDHHPRGVVREGAELEAAQHPEERLCLREGERQRDGLAHALPRRPHLQREDLAGDDPLEGPPRDAEPGVVQAHQRHHRHRVPARHRLPAVAPQPRPVRPRHARQAHQQHAAAHHEQRPPPVPVHGQRRRRDGRQAHHVGDDGPQDGLLAREPHRVEQQRREQRHHDHPRQLEEHRDGDRHHQVRAVLPPHDAPERAGVVLPVLLRGAGDVLELGVDVGGGSADAAQRGAGLVELPAQDEAVGRVRDERGAHQDDGGRDDGDAERQPPAPDRDGVGAVVHQVGHEHPHVEEEVEDARERPAPPRRSYLRQVHRRRLQHIRRRSRGGCGR